MIRTLIPVVLLAAVLGGMMAWLQAQGRSESRAIETHTVLKPPSGSAPTRHGPGVAPARVPLTPGRRPRRPRDAGPGRQRRGAAAAWPGPRRRATPSGRSTSRGRATAAPHFVAPSPWRKVPIYRYTSGDKEGWQGGDLLDPRPAPPCGGRVVRSAGLGRGDRRRARRSLITSPDRRTAAESFSGAGDGPRRRRRSARLHDARRPEPDGTVLAAWLDGRNGGQQPSARTCPIRLDCVPARALVYAGPDGQRGSAPVATSPWCAASDGRDNRRVPEHRRRTSRHLDRPLAVRWPSGVRARRLRRCRDPWTFDGCPHDGPALGLDVRRLHVLWMDAHTGKGRIYAASSRDLILEFRARGRASARRPGSRGIPRPASGTMAVRRLGRGHRRRESGSRTPVDEKKGREHGHHGPDPRGRQDGRSCCRSRREAVRASRRPAVAPRAGAYQLNPALAVATDGAILLAWNELDTRASGSSSRVIEPTRGRLPGQGRGRPMSENDETQACRKRRTRRSGAGSRWPRRGAVRPSGSVERIIDCWTAPRGHSRRQRRSSSSACGRGSCSTGPLPAMPRAGRSRRRTRCRIARPPPTDLGDGHRRLAREAIRRTIVEGEPRTPMPAFGTTFPNRQLRCPGGLPAFVPAATHRNPRVRGAARRAAAHRRDSCRQPARGPRRAEGPRRQRERSPRSTGSAAGWSSSPSGEHLRSVPKELPDLERLADRFRDAGLTVLPVCVDTADAAEATAVASGRPSTAGLRRRRGPRPPELRRASSADDGPDRSMGRLIGSAQGSRGWDKTDTRR